MPLIRSIIAVALVASVSGCITVPTDDGDDGSAVGRDVFLLDYSLTDLSGETRRAPPGDHCGRAFVEDDHIVAERHAYGPIKAADAFVLVDPEWDRDWANYGSDPYLMALPGDVAADDTFIELGWHEGNVTVDGRPVDLPYRWTRTADDGSWRLSGHLRVGPDEIRVIPDRMCR